MKRRKTESEIASLKSQEAKDYCVELLQELETRSQAPLSPGEMQLEELQFELKLKEAEAKDNREREAHEQRLKELELDIESERAKYAESAKRADEIRSQYTQKIQQVADAQEKLSIQLERATREHTVKLQLMESEYEGKSAQLQGEIEELESRRDQLVDEISSLAELQASAADVSNLRAELATRHETAQKNLKALDEEIEAAAFDKKKELMRIQREQELELAELKADHQKMLLATTNETVDKLLNDLGETRINPDELAKLNAKATQTAEQSEKEIEAIRHAATEEFRKQFNITDSREAIDVTELFYQQKSLAEENKGLETQVEKLEAEIGRMRTHIERESERVAKAIEAVTESDTQLEFVK